MARQMQTNNKRTDPFAVAAEKACQSTISRGIEFALPRGAGVLSDQTVLVVDDDTEMQNFLRDVLISQGFSVHTVSNGRDAISEAFTLKPDLILLDLIMASIDGVAVCKALRTNEKTQRTPILVVTGSLSNKQIEESMTSGADDFISKPVDVQDMLVRVRALLKCRDIVDPIERLSRYVETVREMSEGLSHPTQTTGE